MNEDTVIEIGGNSYRSGDLSKTCIQKINSVAQSRQALQLVASLVNHAQHGIDVDLKEALKLLPDPVSDSPSSKDAEQEG